jgi:putative peptide zinc metalloprotease protein
MEKSFHSESWYRVAGLRLQLRSHARLFRQHFRGQLWYVLQDRTSGRFHRFSPSSYLIIAMMDGRRTLQKIWDIACQQLDDEALSQDEVIRLIGQLHSADVLFGEVPPDIDELAERGETFYRRKMMMSLMNPLAMRLPVFDPDRFITATFPLVRPLFSIFGALLFLGVVGYGASLAAVHWGALTTNVADRVLGTTNIVLLLLTYPCVKSLHELGHAYAVKRWGGQVHEIGIMLLVFMPVPYVDASDSLAFQEKWRRALVGAAGILVEIFLAAVAMIVWVNAEEGLVRAFAFNTMLIGGLSTLFFNGNPLLRYDGYYVLGDVLEIPNLASRSISYIAYLIQRYAFNVRSAESPATAPGEPFWFVTYGIASFCYRIFITGVIVLFVSTKFFSLGIIIAVWSLILMFGVPIAKRAWFLLTSPVLRDCRGRAFAVTGAVLGLAGLVLFVMPLPFSTVAEGVVWVDDDGTIHAGADGNVAEVVAVPNAEIAAGDVVLRLEDPLLDSRVRVLRAHREELTQRLKAQQFIKPAEAKMLREQLRHADADLKLALDRRNQLIVRAPSSGRLVLPQANNLVGSYFAKGAVVGYVAPLRDPLIKTIVTEDKADLVRHDTKSIDVRFASDPETVIQARVAREVPALTTSLPSKALSTMGGGKIVLDPTNPNRNAALANLMHLDLRLAPDLPFKRIGERVYVRFHHGKEPLAEMLYRGIRQVFLKRFEI